MEMLLHFYHQTPEPSVPILEEKFSSTTTLLLILTFSMTDNAHKLPSQKIHAFNGIRLLMLKSLQSRLNARQRHYPLIPYDLLHLFCFNCIKKKKVLISKPQKLFLREEYSAKSHQINVPALNHNLETKFQYQLHPYCTTTSPSNIVLLRQGDYDAVLVECLILISEFKYNCKAAE